MNVLVYSGPGTTIESVKHCVESLKLHLSPFYAVIPVTETVLLNEPWMFKTSALVIPGGADLPYCKLLNGNGNERIKKFVKLGGKYIGFCAGAYYASKRCEFEVGSPLEVTGNRELQFFPGTKQGCAYKGFVYESHQGARATPLTVNKSVLSKCSNTVYNYYNGGGVFLNALSHRGVEVLARYSESLDIEDDDKAAVIYCKYGKGDVLLSGTHPEFTASLMRPTDSHAQHICDTLKDQDIETNRKLFLQQCLMKLGLRVNEDLNISIPKTTPIYLSSFQQNKASDLVKSLKSNLDFVNGNTLEDNTDTFVFHDDAFMDEEESDVTNIQVCSELPDNKLTPYFNMKDYYNHLEELFKSEPIGDFGSYLGYGEVVTSTNALLESNPQLLRHLPNGFTFTATTQVAGRGRGGNVWINPKGVMASSVLFKMPSGSSIVTLQYLCGLAMIEAILSYGSDKPGEGIGYEDMPIKLKWPNDIYALKTEFYKDINDKNIFNETVEGDDQKYAKISGALVNSQYLDKTFHLVWGCGVNVSNFAPTTSLNMVLNRLNELRQEKHLEPLPPYQHEKLLAKLMFILDKFYNVFLKSGLAPFLPLYYKRWFHSEQKVKVDVEGSGRNLRTCVIKGITSDYGLLIAQDTNTGERLELQPDGNSFDIFKGLVYRKG